MSSPPPTSAASPSASSPPPETVETMEIFVRDLSGEIIPLSLPPSTTISTLKSLLALRTNHTPASLRLSYNSTALTPRSTLLSSSIPESSTLTLALAPRTTARRPTCDYKKATPEKCREQVQRIVGDCGFCGGHFCSKHRLLESHACAKLEDCKKESHERNAERLNAERTVAIRGV